MVVRVRLVLRVRLGRRVLLVLLVRLGRLVLLEMRVLLLLLPALLDQQERLQQLQDLLVLRLVFSIIILPLLELHLPDSSRLIQQLSLELPIFL